MAGSFSARVSRAIRAQTVAWGRFAHGPTCAKTAEPAGKRMNIVPNRERQSYQNCTLSFCAAFIIARFNRPI